jgi:uncharacterized protein YndB with AHSA1/START domain
MEHQSAIHSTFVMERKYPASPERVFDAFADPVKKRRWFVERDHHHVEQYDMDFRSGGKEQSRVRFKEGMPVAGLVCTNDTTYLDVITNRRIVFVSTMTVGGKLISAAMGTLEFLPLGKGTTLLFTHQAAFFEGADGPERREEGWRKLFDSLAEAVSA